MKMPWRRYYDWSERVGGGGIHTRLLHFLLATALWVTAFFVSSVSETLGAIFFVGGFAWLLYVIGLTSLSFARGTITDVRDAFFRRKKP